MVCAPLLLAAFLGEAAKLACVRMAANSATGGKPVMCGRLSHRRSRLSRHQQPNGRLNLVYR